MSIWGSVRSKTTLVKTFQYLLHIQIQRQYDTKQRDHVPSYQCLHVVSQAHHPGE